MDGKSHTEESQKEADKINRLESLSPTPSLVRVVAEKEEKILEMIVTEAKKQIGKHLQEWDEKIYETYTKSGKELAISFQVKLKGNSQSVKVETQMSFTTGKITEKLEGEVNLAPELPFKEKKDAQ